MPKTLTPAGSVSLAHPADCLAELGLLNGSEIIILAIKPSVWYVLLASRWWLAVLAPIAALAGLTIRAGWFPGQSRLLLVTCLGLFLARLTYSLLQWQSRVYILTNLRVLRIRGLIRVEMFQCFLLRLKDVTISVNIAERILGLGTIGLVIESTETPAACWGNVRNPERVRRQIIDAINSLKGQSCGQEGGNLPPCSVLPANGIPDIDRPKA